MARELTAAMLAEVGLSVTRPGYLVQIDFDPVLRISSMGDVNFDGNLFTEAHIELLDVATNEKGEQSARIRIGNKSGAYGALVQNQKVTDRAIKIWCFYAGAEGDAVDELDGAGDDAEVSIDYVTLRVLQQGTRYAFSPRRNLNTAVGITIMLPQNHKLKVGGQTYVLQGRQ